MSRRELCALLVAVATLTGTVRSEFQVNNHVEHHQTHPAVAMNEKGEFVVVWRSHPADGRDGGVFGRCYGADGAPVGDEQKLNVSAADVDNWTPAVAVNPSGEFVVAWVAARDGHCDIVARMFGPHGLALTDEFAVNAASTEFAESMPCIAMNSSGRFAIAWTKWSGACSTTGRSHVAGRVYGPDAVPVGDEFAISTCPSGDWPDIGMDESGRFVVSWIRMGDTYNRPYGEYIMFRQFEADGTPASDVVRITNDLNSRWYGPSVAVDRSGEFLITWAIGPFPYDIVAQHFDPNGAPATEPYVVNSCMQGNQGHPEVATNGDGEYVIAWDSQNQDGSCYGVFGQQCARGAELVGAECPLNTFAAGRQWYPDVAMAADGMYVVTWISEDQDGSGYGIFAEIGPP